MNDPVVRFLVVNTAVSLALALGALACSWVRLRPQIVHLLWLAALVKLITPSVVPVPVWPAPPAEAAPRRPIEFLEVVPLASAGAPSAAGVPPVVASQVPGPADGPSVSQHPSPPASSRPWRPLGPLRPWLLILWAAGSAAWAGLAIGRMARFHRLLRHAEPIIGTSPRVWMIEASISPLLWAFLGRARIVVPKALFGALSEPEREAILRHERAHFRRRDHWVRWVEFAVLATLWWHPLAWWISRRLRAAEEACCDAEVVADMPDRRPYASALLRTALFLSEAAPLPRAATGIGRAATIHHRVQSLMTTPACPRLSFGTSCALLVLTSFVVLAAPVEKPASPPDTKSSKAPPAQTPDSFAPTAPDAIPEATSPVPPDSPPPPESPLWTPPPKPARPFLLGGEDLDLPRRDTIEGQYLSGYMKVQQAEGRQKAGDPEGARRLYRSALAIFENVRARAPEWQPSMVEYRLNLVRRQLALPSSLPVAAGTVVTQLTVKPNQSSRYAIKGSLLEQPWALVADRVEVVHAPSRSPRWSTVVGSGSIRGGWGSWRLTADTLDIDGSTTTLTGNPVLIVDTQFDPPQVVLKGNRAVINTEAELFTLTGSAMGIHPTMEWRTRESDGFIEISLPGSRNHGAMRMSAGTQTIGGTNADRQRAAAELLKTWPGHQTLEEELAPLLQRAEKPDSPVDQWLPEVDGPRQEPLPKEGTPPKKLPG